MKTYKIRIKQNALTDIQEITDWYNRQKPGLGKRFQNTTIEQINSLNHHAFSYAIRYNEFRCMIIKGFPYMVHFYINESSNNVEIYAVISTSRNPKIWLEEL